MSTLSGVDATRHTKRGQLRNSVKELVESRVPTCLQALPQEFHLALTSRLVKVLRKQFTGIGLGEGSRSPCTKGKKSCADPFCLLLLWKRSLKLQTEDQQTLLHHVTGGNHSSCVWGTENPL